MERIKKIISSNNFNHTFPAAITVNNETITNPSDIANAFNNYFAKVTINIQSSIRFSKKKYHDYLPPLNIESFILTPTDSTEVSNIIFSLNQNKSDGPNSIPIKILKLLNKDIPDQLAILFNQSFSSGIFPSILKSLLNYVPYVLSCPTCLVSYVPSCFTCLVPYVPRALRVLCLTCLVPNVLSCLTCLVSYVPFALGASCQTCSCVSRVLGALVTHVFYALLILGLARTLRALLLIVPHLLQVFQVNASHVF